MPGELPDDHPLWSLLPAMATVPDASLRAEAARGLPEAIKAYGSRRANATAAATACAREGPLSCCAGNDHSGCRFLVNQPRLVSRVGSVHSAVFVSYRLAGRSFCRR